MKQMIVLAASIILGLAIYGMIAGRENSIYRAMGEAWEKESELRVLSQEPAR